MSQATIPILLKRYENQLLAQAISILIGIVLISLLAQIAFPLPQTPVPVTGQTFGVALVALLWGRSLGFTIMGLYLLLGAFGVPVFSFGSSGWQWGPNIGYLMGMWAASAVMGYLADSGWTRKFWKAWLAAGLGTILIFSLGLLVLRQFVPSEKLFMMGLYPFLPGEVLKSGMAAWVVSNTRKKLPDVI